MLVLNRKEGQSIWLGPDVTITVLEVGRDFVRLGIAAPPEVSVDRAEVRARKLALAAREAPPCAP